MRIVDAPALLEIEEVGQRLTLADAPPGAITIPQPLRYGWHWISAQDGDVITLGRDDLDSRALGAAKVTLHCSVTPEVKSRLEWLRKMGELATMLDTPTDQEHLARLLGAIQSLKAEAGDATARAIALHSFAEALATNSRSEEAVRAFEMAERAWVSLGDNNRTLAAHLGRVGEMLAVAEYRRVLDMTQDVTALNGAQSYLTARLGNERCLSLQALGRLHEASDCFEWLLATYQALNERGEYLVAAQNFAALQRDRGNLQAAEDLGVRCLAIVSGVDATMMRGRLHLMLADISLRRGRIGEALAHANAALDQFEHAQSGALRWQANALLVIASLYSQLGADDEAYGFLNDAVKRLAPLGAPNRMAAAMNVFADIETNGRRLQSALLWRRAAEETYAQLKMLPSYESTRSKRLHLQIELGDFAQAKHDIAEHYGDYPLDAGMNLMLEAELALHENRPADALHAINELAHMPLSLRNQISAAQVEAKYWMRRGNAEAAQQRLLAQARRIAALAPRTGNPILRYVVTRQALTLRRTAVLAALEPTQRTDTAARINAMWTWVALNASGRQSTDTATLPAAVGKFDHALAWELLVPRPTVGAPPETATQRELLSLLARPERHSTEVKGRVNTSALLAFQHTLDAEAAFLAYLDGATRGALLWVTRDRVELIDAASPDKVRGGVLALRELMRSPNSSVTEIEVAAQDLSAQLLGAMPLTQPARHLYILAEEPLNGVPWDVLTWPGASSFLVDTTTIELVRLDATGRDAESPSPRSLQVMVAAQESDHSMLPPLAAAEAEAAAISNAVSRSAISLQTPPATRMSLMSALQQPGAWVHIAAHGLAQPQRIGYAGIWLEPTGDEKIPTFLSWIDILDSGVNADLVVLNACQLGDSGTAVNGNLSFADAVSRAGAKHVVAALWPISDAAAALWVPAFYSAITSDPHHDAAHALRAAQLRLRESRAFRHPFFWAGMQTIDLMPIGSGAAH
ncbi:MAG TPA: CHAT domain-containing protein [Rudaea sp.]|nr:CHAT domain-containing protein [Rudaea sp.]